MILYIEGWLFLCTESLFSSVKDNNYVLKFEVRPRKRDFRENRVLSLNKMIWTLSLGFNVSLAQHCDQFYVNGPLLIP